MSRAWLIGNALGVQAGWWCCVFGARHPWLLLPVLIGVVLHVSLCTDPLAEAKALLRVGIAGWLLDASLGAVGVFGFAQHPLPIWLALLWLVLACSLNHSLAWARRPVWRGAALGMLGAPLAYLAGAQWAGVALPLGALTTGMVLGVLWAVWLPLSLRLAAWR